MKIQSNVQINVKKFVKKFKDCRRRMIIYKWHQKPKRNIRVLFKNQNNPNIQKMEIRIYNYHLSITKNLKPFKLIQFIIFLLISILKLKNQKVGCCMKRLNKIKIKNKKIAKRELKFHLQQQTKKYEQREGKLQLFELKEQDIKIQQRNQNLICDQANNICRNKKLYQQ
ncbi:unnamed protein product [Paramecium pentaurelia]|uniref:Uncharacterized protein n=1 Tax=Paramecium pentaurelia TaxID=43138 RepID=A0A8S1T8V0_9CILI|nr:unnamed protein product [Paramecium pentaurelia]